jgi:hypothetical protein
MADGCHEHFCCGFYLGRLRQETYGPSSITSEVAAQLTTRDK